MYSSSDEKRIEGIPSRHGELEEYRSEFRRDYARLIHSPSFRRLQGKTQLYPSVESDFFRNRLTHSLEVAQISKSIAIRINNRFKDDKGNAININEDICEFAGLAHDLGHPPFGHQGEEALDEAMMDFGGFEGNAQTLRILSKLEKKKIHSDNLFFDAGKDRRIGLNLTFRSLASILKYDNEIPACTNLRSPSEKERAVKGYYIDELDIVKKIKRNVGGKTSLKNFKTVECKIMDIADDIAYSTYDLEDGLKAGFYTPFKILFSDSALIERVRKKVSTTLGSELTENEIVDTLFGIFSDIFSDIEIDIPKNITKDEFEGLAIKVSQLAFSGSNFLSSNGAVRSSLTSFLVGEFVRGVEFEYDPINPPLSKVWLKDEVRLKVEVLKTFTYESQILSPKLKIAEYRGKEIVRSIFNALSSKNGSTLMPEDHRILYEQAPFDSKNRIICDYIAGMTDRYAIEFYGRLMSENPETIFKPY